jgi:hypothetical protein
MRPIGRIVFAIESPIAAAMKKITTEGKSNP